MLRSFLRYLLLFSILLAATWQSIAREYQLEFPRAPGPRFDNRVRRLYINRLAEEQPEMVMLGDSTLLDGVDPEKLSALTGMEISSFDVPGSASAYWYLVLKNNIVESEHRPKYVMILFRDTILTAPGYRVHGSYFVQLDEFARRNEPVLLERAYMGLMNPLERFLERYLPLYAARVQIRRDADALIRYSLTAWLGCDRACNDKSMYEIFTSANLEPGQLQNAIAAAEGYLYTRRQLDFDRQIDRSFLPEMIRLAQENDTELVLVRLKTLITGEQDARAVERYIGDLSDYLAGENVQFLDFGQDPRLMASYYKDSLHLTQEGEARFTEILAEGLKDEIVLDKGAGK
ncbi:MAG TPA: hypothetical protein VFO91_19360 [Anaerolineales bacterium]|nr:hypothetical protein [Anaerolineales bacterium]